MCPKCQPFDPPVGAPSLKDPITFFTHHPKNLFDAYHPKRDPIHLIHVTQTPHILTKNSLFFASVTKRPLFSIKRPIFFTCHPKTSTLFHWKPLLLACHWKTPFFIKSLTEKLRKTPTYFNKYKLLILILQVPLVLKSTSFPTEVPTPWCEPNSWYNSLSPNNLPFSFSLFFFCKSFP